MHDEGALLRFASHLIKGYRREMDFSDESWEAVEMFITYRRGLLFTFMHDWLKTQPVYESWRRMVFDKPPVISLIINKLEGFNL